MNTIKQTLASILLICLVIFSAFKANANSPASVGTTLSQGDISIVGYNGYVTSFSGAPCGFAFICYQDMATGTVLKFTLNTFNSSAKKSTDAGNANSVENQILYWTNNGSTITKGTVITITGSNFGASLAANYGVLSYGVGRCFYHEQCW